MRTLREHQERAYGLLRTSILTGHKRPMIQAPTGAGKTLLAAYLVAGARRKGNRVTFVVPAKELIRQTVDSFQEEGITDIGVIQADHPMTDSSKPVQVASIQTISRRNYPTTDMVIVDEAHVAHRAVFQWMKADPKMIFVGLSATPWTKGLGKHYDDLIIATTTQELIDAGFLSPFRVFAPTHPDLTGVRTVAGDYHEGELADAMNKPSIAADVVETWIKLGENRPTLCFGVNRAHASALQQQFEKAGVPAGYMDGFTDNFEREEVRKAFEAGRIKVVCNVGVLTTGVDWDVRCLILARPTKSEMLFTQIIGRGLRTADGKDDCVILDHSDTTLRLGFVTDIHHDELDKGRMAGAKAPRERRAPMPKECTSCSYLKPPKVHECPSCGFAPEKQPDIDVLDDELTQVRGKKRLPTPDEKRSWYAQLMGYAFQNSKSDKWVLANYRAKFDEWPYRKSVTAITPTPEVLSWIKSRQIAWAKRKAKAEAGEARNAA